MCFIGKSEQQKRPCSLTDVSTILERFRLPDIISAVFVNAEGTYREGF